MPYVGNKSTTFNTFSATDVSVTDDLTVTDDASVGGDLAITGATTVTGNVGIGITPTVKLDVLLDTDKRIAFSGGIGEIGSTAGFQTINSAGSALTGFGIRASEIRFATDSSEKMRIDSIGAITKPLQPAFLVKKNANQNNIAASTHTDVTFETEVFDTNSDFASNVFTAPVTGKYLLGCSILFGQPAQDAGYIGIRIKTSNRDYRPSMQDYAGMDSALEYWSVGNAFVCDMDANDTAFVSFYQSSGTAQTDIQESADTTNFYGYLLG